MKTRVRRQRFRSRSLAKAEHRIDRVSLALMRSSATMRAVCWEGKETIRVETVPDPVILNARDAIIKVTATAICGSDLHIYDGYIPTMHKGDVLGHEFMGEVVDVGKENTRL